MASLLRPASCLCLLVASAPAQAALFPVAVESATRRTTAGDTVAYDLYLPQAGPGLPAPPWPAVVLNHGFARDKRYHAQNARHLAERGIVALVPNLVSLLGGEEAQLRNIENTIDHVAWLRARSATPGDPLRGLVDPLRIGLAGHSAGGAVAFEAAWQQERSSGIPAAALVLLDAVPWARTVARAGELGPLFAVNLRAEPSACNAYASNLGLLDAVSFPADDVRLVATTHCDPENPSDFLCSLACGAATPRGSNLYQELLYLFLREALQAPAVEAGGGFRERVAALEAQGDAQRETYGPRASLRLKVNGQDPPSGAVGLSSRLRLSLDVIASGDGPAVDWYLAAIAGEQVVWFTAGGPSPTPAPAYAGPAVSVRDAVVVDSTLAPGSTVSFLVALVDGTQLVASDVVTATARR
jgi:pimeloyl-ACP methyl ester carboxylesterase